MPVPHPQDLRRLAVDSVASGVRPVDVARELGVSPTSVYAWVRAAAPHLLRPPARACCRCGPRPGLPQDGGAYAQLLGSYLGDGCLSRGPRAWALRITCDDAWPGVAAEVADVLERVSGNRVQRARKAGCHDVQAYWQHWPCLLPQHGPGPKHLRPQVLEPWQQQVVRAHPGRLLRGLFHSDGWRGENVAVRRAGSTVVRYRYPRYELTSKSDDIRGLCGDALDLLGIAWRLNGPWRISVARREAVAALDQHVGPKH